MTGCATHATKCVIARRILRKAIAEQLERSIPTGLLGTDGQAAVAYELVATITRPGLREALQVLGCDNAGH
ncbi:MAG: hypothetical protein WAN65_22845 [Candidatus Sulfotelmatobacter sp.]